MGDSILLWLIKYLCILYCCIDCDEIMLIHDCITSYKLKIFDYSLYYTHFSSGFQLEGPLSPAELVGILQRTLEEQGVAFGSAKAKQEEKIRADRRLREEQDAAYLAALQIDKVCISTVHILA